MAGAGSLSAALHLPDIGGKAALRHRKDIPSDFVSLPRHLWVGGKQWVSRLRPGKKLDPDYDLVVLRRTHFPGKSVSCTGCSMNNFFTYPSWSSACSKR